MTLKSDANFGEKSTCGLQNDIRNMKNFYQRTQMSQNWDFDGIVQNWHEEFDEFWSKLSKVSKICNVMGSFWTKYTMFELKKYRGVMFPDTEEWWKI